MHSYITRTIHVLMITAIPIALVLTNVRLVMLPWYHNIQYSSPSFPADPYGFTQTDRRRHANVALEFLLNDSGLEFLSEQTLPSGQRLYNERELSHMQDVKSVTQITLNLWRAALAVTLCTGLSLAWRTSTRAMLRSGLMVGSSIVVVSILVLGLYIMLNFNSFFTHFHEVLFESGTWTFTYSDTLIRLFPLKFWADVFVIVSGASLLEGMLLLWAAFRFQS